MCINTHWHRDIINVIEIKHQFPKPKCLFEIIDLLIVNTTFTMSINNQSKCLVYFSLSKVNITFTKSINMTINHKPNSIPPENI